MTKRAAEKAVSAAVGFAVEFHKHHGASSWYVVCEGSESWDSSTLDMPLGQYTAERLIDEVEWKHGEMLAEAVERAGGEAWLFVRYNMKQNAPIFDDRTRVLWSVGGRRAEECGWYEWCSVNAKLFNRHGVDMVDALAADGEYVGRTEDGIGWVVRLVDESMAQLIGGAA